MNRIAFWPCLLFFSLLGIVLTGGPYSLLGKPTYPVDGEVARRIIQSNFISINHQTLLGRERTLSKVVLGDSLALQSRDSYCRGANPVLTVTGTNVKWYADAGKKTKLAEGATYHSPSLDQTTTFYLTQTLAGAETPPVAITIEIVEAVLINVVTTSASCGKNDGILSVTATGGTTRNPMYYSLNRGPAQRSPVFTNLAPGNYLLMDSVAAGCWGTIEVVIASPPAPIISSVVPGNPHCGNADGTLTISAFGGAGSLSYSLNGVDFTTSYEFKNLSGGDYRVWVRDQSGCSVSQSVILPKSVRLQLNVIEVRATTCGQSNGRIALNSTTGNGMITYSIDGTQINSSGIVDQLSAKNYVVTVNDETGCSDTKSVSIARSEGPVIKQIQLEPPNCGSLNGRLTIAATSTSKLDYSLNGMAFQSDSTYAQLPTGNYEIAVKDGKNCIAKQIVELGEPCEETVYLTNSFSPNGDGINDGWAILFPTASVYLNELRIFNRWGELIFQSGPHPVANGEILWNGTYKDQIVPGSYTYRLIIRSSGGKNHVYQGTVFCIALK